MLGELRDTVIGRGEGFDCSFVVFGKEGREGFVGIDDLVGDPFGVSVFERGQDLRTLDLAGFDRGDERLDAVASCVGGCGAPSGPLRSLYEVGGPAVDRLRRGCRFRRA